MKKITFLFLLLACSVGSAQKATIKENRAEGPITYNQKTPATIGSETVQLPAAYYNNTAITESENANLAATGERNLNVIVPFTGTYYNHRAPNAIIYDNGPYFNVAASPNRSVLQSETLGMDTYGANAAYPSGFSVADDVVLTQDVDITSIDVFAYQTASTAPSITAVYLRVWNSDPSAPGATIVWGNLTTNILGTAVYANANRVLETAQFASDRQISRVTALTNGLTLTAGTYWLEYSFAGSGSSGPWAPPIVILGQSTTGNGMQNNGTEWTPLLDGGTSAPYGFPFVIYGTPSNPLACAGPTALTVANVTETSVDVSWTAGGTETAWEVRYGIAGFDPDTAGTLVSVATNPQTTISSLSASTSYDVYVRAVCAVGDESVWIGPVNFATVCGSISTPWSEGFESGMVNTNIVPTLSCWTQEYVTGQENWKFVTTNQNNSVSPHGGSLMAEYRVASFSLPATKLITPSMDLTSLTTPQLTFYFANAIWGTDVDELRVYYKQSESDPSWTLIPGAVYTDTHTAWEKVELILPAAAGATTYQIAFEATSQYARGLNLDDISIGDAAGCIAPSAIAISGLTENSATVTWTAGQSETVWEVKYGSTGFDPNTAGTLINVTPNPETTITGLTTSTNYDIYVRALCAVGDESTWTGPVSFTTTCGAATVPYVLDFESADVPNLPSCTSREKFGDVSDWVTSNVNAYGFNSKVLRRGYDPDSASNAWFYTQGIELIGGTEYEISYKYGNDDSFGDTEKMKVAYGSAPQAAAMTNQLADHPSIQGGIPTINTVTFVPTTSGVYYFGFHSYSDEDQWYLYLDDISVNEMTVGINGHDIANINYFPNPVKDKLNLTAGHNIDQITVYNLLGQPVIQLAPRNTNVILDMSMLPMGTYLVKATADDSTSTFKVIKQ